MGKFTVDTGTFIWGWCRLRTLLRVQTIAKQMIKWWIKFPKGEDARLFISINISYSNI